MIIGSNFDLSSRIYLDSRQLCESYNELILNRNHILYPPGFEVYCFKEKAKFYNACENEEDEPLWKLSSVGELGDVFIESSIPPTDTSVYWIDTGEISQMENQSAYEGMIGELITIVQNLQSRIVELEKKVVSGGGIVIPPSDGKYLILSDDTPLQLSDGSYLELG